ncbi:MAG TPA: AraC family transcriptional regulator [Thermomicrobiales bacterium]|nr:AraC family transcriptional regulator [Thermomicrobiales bacterium]
MHKSPRNMHETQPGTRWLHSAGPYRSELGIGKPLHTHPVWEVVYYLQGHPKCRVNDDLYDTEPGLMIALPPGVPHGEVTNAPWACYWVLFDDPDLVRQTTVIIDDSDASLRQAIALLVREWRSDQPHREAMIDALLCQLGVIIQRATAAAIPTSAELLVEQFERALEDQFQDMVSISVLCEQFGVSASYMRAQFRRYRGVSPMERVQQMRVRQAISSIQNSTLTLDAIAETCGYSSASHLSRQVKRVTGRPPGSFRTSFGS